MKRKWDSTDVATTSAYVDDGDLPLGAEFEVFLSFRGPDTRLNFTDCLYHRLVAARIRVFKDDEEIRKGEKIGGELSRAIESSKIYVPIFSRNYASSAWCLRELTHMVECSSKANGKVILPIFYDVNPDDVKVKTRLYLDALEKHKEKSSCEDVQRWKEALTKVGRIKGWDLKDKGQGEIIEAILDEVITKLTRRSRNLPDHLLGIHNHVRSIVDLLNEGSHDVRYLIIHGMGGIGKTTLASIVFNQMSNQFRACSFLLDIRESAQRGRIIDLQKQLISDFCQGKSPEIYHSIDVGVNIIRERFRDKKVLLVLDNVDKWDQLCKLAEKSDWFGPGSKIIITTRDINFLPIKEEDKGSSIQVHSGEFKIYEMTEMDSSHALQLFSKHAFGMDFPLHDFDDLSRKIIRKTGGLPLALEVVGSSLRGRTKRFWKDTLRKLDLVPNLEVLDKLKTSYDMLDNYQREIFLDIACYFIGKEIHHPYYMWKASSYFPKRELFVLTRMSLIKIVENDTLWMHDQLRDLGREIVRREDDQFPEKRSRLWEPKIAFDVVRMKEGMGKVVAVRLRGLSKKHNFTSEEFSKLPNLRFLELEGGNLVGDFKNLLSKLKWLSWIDCPSELNATNLCLEELAVLELSGSNITEDWTGWESCLVSENLRVIQISDSPSLKSIPDLSKCLNLKRLVLQDVAHLLVVDGSLSKLEHLKHLEITNRETRPGFFVAPFVLGGPKSLSMLKIQAMQVGEIHHSIGEMTRLKYLSLDCCRLLGTLPDFIGNLKSLLELDLNGTGITGLPHSIGDLKMLRKICLYETKIEKLPNSIGGLESLCELDLTGTYITELPTSIGNLKKLEILRLDSSAIREVPKVVGMLENLKELSASWCDIKGEIPSEIGGSSFLRTLNLEWNNIRRLPTSLNQLSHLQQLRLKGCFELEQLPALPVSLKKLKFSAHLLWTALDLSYLTNLVRLHISDNTHHSSECRQGAPKIEWIERLFNLEKLTLRVENVTLPPVNLATLSRLQDLNIIRVDPRSLMGLPSSLERLVLRHVESPKERSLFSNLTNLFHLELNEYCQREVEFDVFGQQQEKLHSLNVNDGKLLERLSVSRLKGLRQLGVCACPQLMEIEGVERLESLESLTIFNCRSLKQLPNLSKLKELRRLSLSDFPLQNLSNLSNTCQLEVIRCGTLPNFYGNYKEWRDAQS